MNWMLLSSIGVLAAVFSYQYSWWLPSVSYAHPRILMYHMVSRHKPKARFNKLRVDPEEFERQIRWLSENGWSFEFMSAIHEPSSQKRVALTFDDGYRDNLLLADPILKKYQARATLYLVADRHGRDWSKSKKASHSDGELMNEPKLLDEDVAALLESNRWELGAHSMTHANLAAIDPVQRTSEVIDCKEELQARFGTNVETFAYPFGIYGPEDVESVESAGYSTAVTTEQGISQDTHAERLNLRRVKVSGNDGMFSFRLRMRTGKRSVKN